VTFAQLTPPPASPLEAYPDWLVLAVAVIVTAAGIWILGKLLKWALWLLLVAVLAVGGLGVVLLLLG